MSLTEELGRRVRIAETAARRAGAVVMEYYGKLDGYRNKGEVDLVSEADTASEDILANEVHSLFPDDALLLEESGAKGPNGGFRWLIDPVDGTTNFVHGHPMFGVSIAIEHDDELVAGVVYLPALGEMFSATRGQGATLNGQPIRVSAVERLDRALVATGFPYDRRQNPEPILAYVKAGITHAQGFRRGGSASVDLCYVACGRLDGYFEEKLSPWDVGAGVVLVREAGGMASAYDGEPIRPPLGAETLATNGLIHAELGALVSGVQRELAR